jgi:methyl-accepting chemotaxis protein
MSLEKKELLSIYNSMAQFSYDMQSENQHGIKIAKKTSFFIRLLVILFLFGMAFVLYKSNDLIHSTEHLASSMVKMYIHFGEMSSDVNAMNNSIKSMETSIHDMPALANNMVTMSNKVASMKANVNNMASSVTQMEFKMSRISSQVSNMTYHFSRVNNSVSHIQENTHQMAQPLQDMKNIFPFMP